MRMLAFLVLLKDDSILIIIKFKIKGVMTFYSVNQAPYAQIGCPHPGFHDFEIENNHITHTLANEMSDYNSAQPACTFLDEYPGFYSELAGGSYFQTAFNHYESDNYEEALKAAKIGIKIILERADMAKSYEEHQAALLLLLEHLDTVDQMADLSNYGLKKESVTQQLLMLEEVFHSSDTKFEQASEEMDQAVEDLKDQDMASIYGRIIFTQTVDKIEHGIGLINNIALFSDSNASEIEEAGMMKTTFDYSKEECKEALSQINEGMNLLRGLRSDPTSIELRSAFDQIEEGHSTLSENLTHAKAHLMCSLIILRALCYLELSKNEKATKDLSNIICNSHMGFSLPSGLLAWACVSRAICFLQESSPDPEAALMSIKSALEYELEGEDVSIEHDAFLVQVIAYRHQGKMQEALNSYMEAMRCSYYSSDAYVIFLNNLRNSIPA